MNIFEARNEIIGNNPIIDDDGRQEKLAEVAINIALNHPQAIVIDDVTYLVHDGSREIAYVIASATGAGEPNEAGVFVTAATEVCAPGFAMKVSDGYPDIVAPEDVEAILEEVGQDA